MREGTAKRRDSQVAFRSGVDYSRSVGFDDAIRRAVAASLFPPLPEPRLYPLAGCHFLALSA
jgi:hypothetical protein